MYCYDVRAALGHMARVLAPGGRLMLLVWGRAARVWWSPVIDLIESRAEYYASVCPMMFFYGLPGVLSRMAAEAGLTVTHDEAFDERMSFPSVADAVESGIFGGALAGLFMNRLDAGQQAEVRSLLGEHLAGMAEPSGDEVRLPAEIRIVVAGR
jgi:SAM-dependent methyltransferase